MNFLLSLSAIFLVINLTGCDATDFRETKIFAGGIVATADTLNMGRNVYVDNCLACHGNDGGGNGPASKGLTPTPRNFKQGLYKFGTVQEGGWKCYFWWPSN